METAAKELEKTNKASRSVYSGLLLVYVQKQHLNQSDKSEMVFIHTSNCINETRIYCTKSEWNS